MFPAKERIRQAETSIKQLENDVRALKSEWDTQLTQLADLKEQVRNAISRLTQRQKRGEVKEDNGKPEQKPINPAAQRLLEGAYRGVLPPR